jgi:hypothetical protein
VSTRSFKEWHDIIRVHVEAVDSGPFCRCRLEHVEDGDLTVCVSLRHYLMQLKVPEAEWAEEIQAARAAIILRRM